jgi:hypothetical protein
MTARPVAAGSVWAGASGELVRDVRGMISLPVRDTRDFAPISAFVVRGSPRDTHAGAEKVRQETGQDEETFRLRCIIRQLPDDRRFERRWEHLQQRCIGACGRTLV